MLAWNLSHKSSYPRKHFLNVVCTCNPRIGEAEIDGSLRLNGSEFSLLGERPCLNKANEVGRRLENCSVVNNIGFYFKGPGFGSQHS